MIKQECLDRILDANTLVDVAISLGISGQKRGAQWTGKSPFTDEKSGSFQISESKGIWKCFSSGKGSGGRMAAVQLVMDVQSVDWYSAIKYLAGLKNIVIEFDEDTLEKREERKSLQDASEKAELIMRMGEQYYAANRGDEVFVNFLNARKLTEEDVARWGLGWAPLYSKHLATEVQRKDMLKLAVDIGIVKQSAEDSSKIYDALSSRVTIAIRDGYGRTVGFAGRYVEVKAMEKTPPKFVNPSESFFYSKSKLLYGWYEARKSINSTDTVYVVEGYADVWAMHRAGLTNTVAHCGKFITQGQMAILSKACGNLIFLLEDNEAVAGYEKCLADALKLGFAVKVCDLRVAKGKRDADDLWKEVMGGMFTDLEDMQNEFGAVIRTHTKDGIEFSIGQLEALWASPSNHGKAVEEIIELLMMIKDAYVRDGYLKLAAKLLNEWSAAAEYKGKLADLEESLAKSMMTEKQFATAKKSADTARQKKLLKWDAWEKSLMKHMGDAVKKAKAADMGSDADVQSQRVSWSDGELMPDWVDEKEMKRVGFVQRTEGSEMYPIGIYFPFINGMTPSYNGTHKATNYSILPKYHIKSTLQNRRVVMIDNGREQHTIDLPDKALTSISNWEEVMINKGDFVASEVFSKYHFVKIRNYITSRITTAHEITTLGWQPANEFWSWSNAVAFKEAETGRLSIREYDNTGIVEVNDKKYLSASMSEFSRDMMDEGKNPYENDLYLSFKDGGHNFADWANLFMEVYNDHGDFGVAFALLSINKDLVYKMQQKMPLLYLYGPKGSGKSAFGESLQNLFFSGTNSDGRLIQAVNMTPGMISPYAFYNALSRFRNCFRLFNEYDPMVIDQSFRGMFKAAYDGEGRERGSGDGFVRTEIQKVLGTIGLAGQYLDTNDDGALMSRSINLSFSEERNKTRTDDQKEKYRMLMTWEKQGLSGAVLDIIKWRPYFADQLEAKFYDTKKQLIADARAMGKRNLEERLLNNYSLLISAMEVANGLCTLRNSIDGFYKKSLMKMIELSNMLTENNVLTKFWRSMETLWQDGLIKEGNHFTIGRKSKVTYRSAGGTMLTKEFGTEQVPLMTEVMVIQIGKMMGVYEKEMRARGHKAINEATVLEYLKDQPYFIGLITHHHYNDSMKTSGYAIRYEELKAMCGVTFQSHEKPAQSDEEDMPF